MILSNLEKYRRDLTRLIALGDEMHLDFVFRVLEKEGKLSKDQQEAKKKIGGSFEKKYQRWFTEA